MERLSGTSKRVSRRGFAVAVGLSAGVALIRELTKPLDTCNGPKTQGEMLAELVTASKGKYRPPKGRLMGFFVDRFGLHQDYLRIACKDK